MVHFSKNPTVLTVGVVKADFILKWLDIPESIIAFVVGLSVFIGFVSTSFVLNLLEDYLTRKLISFEMKSGLIFMVNPSVYKKTQHISYNGELKVVDEKYYFSFYPVLGNLSTKYVASINKELFDKYRNIINHREVPFVDSYYTYTLDEVNELMNTEYEVSSDSNHFEFDPLTTYER